MMDVGVIDIVKYVGDNYSVILNIAVVVLISAYFFYGLLLAMDASKRYRSSWAPVIVFVCWLLLSVVFVPIYLIVRPDYGAAERVEASKTDIALLMSSGLYLCDGCENVVERKHKYCLNCGRSLQIKCLNCNSKVQRNWKMCPECGHVVSKKPTNKSVFGNGKIADSQTNIKVEVADTMSKDGPSQSIVLVENESSTVKVAEKLNTAQEI